ncbi:hypothetical protein [Micromonospora endolithica]|uniref:Pecanex-like protein 1 n=1 Tax=Micromonospora endolithica TaxID=230091 RepID=A0A3A9YX69_9ACTN|nr:hypothetical protein [Micromonospora endolithica]RKN40641.1 hypothetical protein D7223_26275 [Micromonospora endolithica]TWJ21731.1 hypothetical protein JD76_01842 [Micromonospora endolithica]
MRRSTRARRSPGIARSKRLLAVVGTLAVFGGIVAVTQISSAGDRPSNRARPASAACVEPSPGATAPSGRDNTSRTWQNGRWVRNHWGDGQQTVRECQETRDGGSPVSNGGSAVACPDVASRLPQIPERARAEVDRNLALLQTQITEADRRLAAEGNRGDAFIRNAILGPLAAKRKATLDRITTAIDRAGPRPRGLAQLATCQVAPTGNPSNGGNDGGGDNNGGGNNGGGDNGGNNGGNNGAPGAGLGVLANNCDNTELEAHDGFQNGNRCVSTAFGEVGADANNPSLLITDFPQQVGANQPFTLQVSTKNLVRDRFLAAGQGGYYVESSLLNEQGLVRGHFHTACRMLSGTDEAPGNPEAVPAFFVATEDGGGGADADQVTIQVPGLPQSGTAQCAVWAGDGSHRIPMMARANQTPAFDAVRIEVN